jgi:hypothetical protein
MWCMHDGASAHFSRVVWDILNNTYHDRGMGRGGPTAWSSLSPDFSPLDFHPWGHLKTLGCAALVDNVTTKRHFTIALWMSVRLSATTSASLNGCDGPWWDVSRRALNLMGDILSTYYKCILSAITHKLNVSGHMLICTFFLVLVCGTRAKICPHLSVTPCVYVCIYCDMMTDQAGHCLVTTR